MIMALTINRDRELEEYRFKSLHKPSFTNPASQTQLHKPSFIFCGVTRQSSKLRLSRLNLNTPATHSTHPPPATHSTHPPPATHSTHPPPATRHSLNTPATRHPLNTPATRHPPPTQLTSVKPQHTRHPLN
ncbi:hypothetical protein BaRGS_00013229 [Batillaria attramentaria]|uniref:Uncharacterized protein n=1 Tax=Batillaria attramentaria TaxID=370345 RepID=A0ABD0L8E0_9CAEN